VIGLVTGAVAIGVSELVAGIFVPGASPVIAVGQAAIDLSPEWMKSFAIRTFGEDDKLALLIGIGAVLAVVAAVLGVWSLRRPAAGIAGLVGLGLLGGTAALTRPGSVWGDAAPAVAGVVAGVPVLRLLRAQATGTRAPARVSAQERRRFLLTAAGGVAFAAAGGGLGAWLTRRTGADDSRAGVRIPEPASEAVTGADTDLGVAGVSSFVTPNDRFYRVDTALLVPSVMAEEWRLRIHGMVDRELTLDYRQLLDRPMIERDITLACVSNPVGGRYVGNARWIGTPVPELLREVGVQPGADQIVTRSADGWTCGTPTSVVMDGRDAMLAVAMNGEPLPLSHGFPVRMVVPGLYGYVSATKWLVDMELTTFDAFDAYWIERGWAERAPVKTMSRIDTPTGRTPVAAGEVPIGGVAWAQHVGIEGVEVQIDDGPWLPAELGGVDSLDTWRQWVLRWDSAPGDYRLRVRATDRAGTTQLEERVEPFPDGAEGWHTVYVRVE
jgi:DMSO/TMAO reductase YedYZ molybdopterin-dependent catalytic subunit